MERRERKLATNVNLLISDHLDERGPRNTFKRKTVDCNPHSGYMSKNYHRPLCQAISESSTDERRLKITINVSGERYQTYIDTLDKFPDTLLGNKYKREFFYDNVEDEYFFDRDRNAFNAILYYYQSNGQLYCPLTVPMSILVTEAKFFKLGNAAIKQVLDLETEGSKSVMPKRKWQKRIWCLMEHPETSRAAHCITLFSVFMILLTVACLCIETLPAFKFQHQRTTVLHPMNSHQVPNTTSLISARVYLAYSEDNFGKSKNATQNKSEEYDNNNNDDTIDSFVKNSIVVSQSSASNDKCSCNCQCLQPRDKVVFGDTAEERDNKIMWKKVFEITEAVCVTWFSIEFILRFISSPDKKQFAKGFLNIVDILSILPFFITIALKTDDNTGLENFRIIRLVRVFRIFKLSRHSKGLQILGKTLQASLRELGLLIFFIGIGVVLFSSAVYYLESENFGSIPDAFWWSIITMCTVGYGDTVPKTFLAKIVGSICSICGVLCIALPVPVIVSNFDYFYNRERTKKMHEEVLELNKEQCNRGNGNGLFRGRKKRLSSESSHQSSIRSDRIQRQNTLKDMEKQSRKVSQRLFASPTSVA